MKASNKFAIVMAIVLIILPCVSYALMNKKISVTKKEIARIAKELTIEEVEEMSEDGYHINRLRLIDEIKVLHINGVRTTKNLLSISPVAPIKCMENKICLNLEASSMYINKDTLFISIDDPSQIYQGFIRIRDLKTIILNGDTTNFSSTISKYENSPK